MSKESEASGAGKIAVATKRANTWRANTWLATWHPSRFRLELVTLPTIAAPGKTQNNA